MSRLSRDEARSFGRLRIKNHAGSELSKAVVLTARFLDFEDATRGLPTPDVRRLVSGGGVDYCGCTKSYLACAYAVMPYCPPGTAAKINLDRVRVFAHEVRLRKAVIRRAKQAAAALNTHAVKDGHGLVYIPDGSDGQVRMDVTTFLKILERS